MTESKTTLDEAKELLRGCVNQFRSYEKLHHAKGTPEAEEKALINGAIADTLDEFLRRNP